MEKLKIAERQHTSKKPDTFKLYSICGKTYTEEQIMKRLQGYMKKFKKHYDYLKDR